MAKERQKIPPGNQRRRKPEVPKSKHSAPTTAGEWREKSGKFEPLEVPSGNVALVRAVGMDVLIQRGMIPNSLMPAVVKALEDPTNDDPRKFLKELQLTPEKVVEMSQAIDAVVCYCVVRPSVFPAPLDEDGKTIPFSQRPEIEGLWVDEVDEEDKEFLFQFATGGTRDLETFRDEQASLLESLSDRGNVEVQAQ